MQSQIPANAAATLDAQFDQQFKAAVKHASRQCAGHHAAPIFARDVQPGEHFIIDSAPFVLYVRAYFLDAHPDSFNSVPVVVIAAANGTTHVQVGCISNLSPIQTVRLVDVIGPLQVRAR